MLEQLKRVSHVEFLERSLFLFLSVARLLHYVLEGCKHIEEALRFQQVDCFGSPDSTEGRTALVAVVKR